MELSRRQLLAALGGNAAAAGGYLLTRDGDSCPAMRKPNWTVGGDRWSRAGAQPERPPPRGSPRPAAAN